MERLAAPELPGWLDEMVPFDRYLVEVDEGLRMHVMEQGHGRPVLLFHGNPTWGFLYRKVAAELAGEPLRLIMPDLMGLGFSDRPPPDGHTMRNHSGWMASLISQLDLEDVVAVVQDWGGPIGMHALSQFPGLMTSAVVLNTGVTTPRPGFKPTAFHRFSSSGIGGFTATNLGLIQSGIRFFQGDRKSISGDVARAYRYPLQRKFGNEAPVALVRMVPDDMSHSTVEPMGEVQAFVEAFDGPAAIVWGEADPVLGRLKNRTSRLLPQAEVTSTDAGHFVQEEVPAEIAAAIRSVT